MAKIRLLRSMNYMEVTFLSVIVIGNSKHLSSSALKQIYFKKPTTFIPIQIFIATTSISVHKGKKHVNKYYLHHVKISKYIPLQYIHLIFVQSKYKTMKIHTIFSPIFR